ncbi:hypothetical protein BJ742DRAFT_793141 [Cladochytrium replicatum]|nr:hypothetical protein BJ742DRAFT_793141 [Cladochytrium replicatum]
MLLNCLLVLLCLLNLVSAHGESTQKLTPYKKGDIVRIECPKLDADGSLTTEWEPGPICMETGEPLAFPFATDGMFQCTIQMDPAWYKFIADVLKMKASWRCRVPTTNDEGTIYFNPLTFSLWGAVEDTHIHLMNHHNFVFHVVDGFFMASATYALRDHFVMLTDSSQFVLHGLVRWFVGINYDLIADEDVALQNQKLLAATGQHAADTSKDDGNANKAEDGGGSSGSDERSGVEGNDKPKDVTGQPQPVVLKPVTKDDIPTVSSLLKAVKPAVVISYCLLSAASSAGVCALIYIGILKPKLIKEYRKQK